jgi:hypothetical protein
MTKTPETDEKSWPRERPPSVSLGRSITSNPNRNGAVVHANRVPPPTGVRRAGPRPSRPPGGVAKTRHLICASGTWTRSALAHTRRRPTSRMRRR